MLQAKRESFCLKRCLGVEVEGISAQRGRTKNNSGSRRSANSAGRSTRQHPADNGSYLNMGRIIRRIRLRQELTLQDLATENRACTQLHQPGGAGRRESHPRLPKSNFRRPRGNGGPLFRSGGTVGGCGPGRPTGNGSSTHGALRIFF